MLETESRWIRLFLFLSVSLCFLPFPVRAESAEDHPAPLGKTFTLDEAERLAVLNDARLLTAEQDVIIASERVKEARYLFLPELGLQGNATRFNAQYPFATPGDFPMLLFPNTSPALYGVNTGGLYSGMAYMRMNLYEGGKGINTLRLAKAAENQASNLHDSAHLDVLYSVKDVFFKLILAQERMTAADEYLAELERAAKAVSLNAWDRLETESRLEEARARSSEVKHSLEMQRLEFLKSLNLELDTPFHVVGELKTAPVHIDIEKAILWALELRPELRSETYRAQMDEISVNLAQARRIPTVFLSGDYEVVGYDFPLRNDNWAATLGVRIPLAYDYWSELQQKRAQQRQGQLKRAELQDRVRLEVRQAYESLQYWQKEYPLREERYRRMQSLYDAASRTPGSALAKSRALSTLLDLKVSYLSAVAEHILARSRLERAVGREITE